MTTERDIRNQIAYARDEGKKEGREEGKIEERMVLAKKCKAEGIPVETISRITGLSEQEIADLK